MKNYIVYYIIKAHCTETGHSKIVEAKNASEACKEVKRMVYAETGRNAFRPEAEAYEEGMTTETIASEKMLNYYQNGMNFDESFYKERFTKTFNEAVAKGFSITKDVKGSWKVRA